MDFSAVLDGIARGEGRDEGSFTLRGPLPVPEFWQVLERIHDAPPVSHDTLQAAYFPDEMPREPIASEDDAPLPELSLDPEDIAYELCLADAVSAEELSVLRRRFAMLNHPDRVAPAQRDRATKRMTIANAMIDEAQKRFLD